MKRIREIILIAFVFCLVAGQSTHGQENFIVREVELEGNETLSSAVLKSQMATYATGSFRQKILGKEPYYFSEAVLQGDLTTLRRYYQRHGFLYAKAEVAQLDADTEAGTVRIAIRLTEGDSITVRDVNWRMDDSAAVTDPVADSIISSRIGKITARTGRRFRDAAVNADRLMLVRALENAGFPFAEARPELAVDESNLAADIQWLIRPGPRAEFGDIQISGNIRVSEELIRGALEFRSGDRYSRYLLEESQRRVFGLGLFHIVTVTAQLSGDRSPIVPVDVRIKEAPRLNSKIGFGYGREEKFRVYSDSYYLGFLGGARRLNLFVKHSDLEPYHVSLKLTQPAFLTDFTTLELNPFLLRQDEPAYILTRYGGNASLLHRFSHSLHSSVTYSFERVDLDTASIADVSVAEVVIDDAYNKSSLLLGTTFDNSSPMFAPARGYYAAAIGKLSGLDLGSEYHFTRLLVDLRRYQPLWGMVLAGRIKGGGIRSRDDHEFVPVEDRFYAGGSASVRGWARAELGPMADDGTPIGGYSLLEASVSLRFPIIGILSGAMFTDFGNVWRDSYSYKIDDLRYSAGLGIRVSTPIGPIRLDVARPVFDDETTGQVHISVGEAF